MGLVNIFKKEQDDRSFIGKNQAVSTNRWGHICSVMLWTKFK